MSSAQAPSTTDITRLRTRTELYVALLESLLLSSSLQDAQDISTDLILGRLLIKGLNLPQGGPYVQAIAKPPISTHDELISMGLPQQRQLSSSLQRQLLKEAQRVLRDMESFVLAEEETQVPGSSVLFSVLQEQREVFSSIRNAIEAKTENIKSLLPNIHKLRQDLDAELRGLLDTVPLSTACHSAQGELWSASVESALIRLSLLKAHSERQFYNHTIRNKDTASTVRQALEVAYNYLLTQEKNLTTEARSLDVQLRDYTTLLELVDGGKRGAFKQVVDDWTKIKQETDECLKDLRRLGWTGE